MAGEEERAWHGPSGVAVVVTVGPGRNPSPGNEFLHSLANQPAQELEGECGSILEGEIGQPACTGQPASDMWQVYASASYSRAASTQPPQRTAEQLAEDEKRFREKYAIALIRWEKKMG